MKKGHYYFVFLFLFLAINFQSQGQSEVSVNTAADEIKTTSKARSIAFTNTLSPIALGLGTVTWSENNTIETAGAVLAVYGLIMGPSTGNFYAEDYQRGTIGMAARTVGAYLMADATREIFGNDFADALTIDDKKVSLTDTKVLIGGVLVLGSMVYNILSTQASVEEYNNSRSRFSVRFNPDIINNKVAPMLTAQIRL